MSRDYGIGGGRYGVTVQQRAPGGADRIAMVGVDDRIPFAVITA